MALIIRGTTECALCHEILGDEDDIIGTSHFIDSPSDRFYNFSDAAMHRTCFLAWGMRARFIRRYNQVMGSLTFGNGTYHHMTDDGTIQILRREDAP
jgi:hypothetical protein